MELLERCEDLIPDNEDKKLVTTLLRDACMNARLSDNDEEIYFAYIKVLEEYVYLNKIGLLRKRMVDYWNEQEKYRDRT